MSSYSNSASSQRHSVDSYRERQSFAPRPLHLEMAPSRQQVTLDLIRILKQLSSNAIKNRKQHQRQLLRIQTLAKSKLPLPNSNLISIDEHQEGLKREREKWELIVQTKNSLISQLQENISALSSSQQSQSESKQQIKIWQLQCEQLREEVRSLKQQIQRGQQEQAGKVSKDQSDFLAQTRLENKKLTKDLQQAANKLKAVIQSAEAAKTANFNDKVSLNSQLEEKSQKIRLLGEAQRENIVKNEELSTQVSQLRQKVKILEQQTRLMGGSLDKISQQKESLQSQKLSIQQQKQKIWMQMKKIQLQKQELASKLSQAAKQLKDIQQSQQSRQRQNQQLAMLQQEISSCKTPVLDQPQDSDSMSDSLKSDQLKPDIASELEAKLRKAEQTNMKLENAHKELKGRLFEALATIDQLKAITLMNESSSGLENSNEPNSFINNSQRGRTDVPHRNIRSSWAQQGSKRTLSQRTQEDQMLKDLNPPASQYSPNSSNSLKVFFSPHELASKIPDFNFKGSVVNKINTSKFINSYSAKISFIFQYACLLELYFLPPFLSTLREQLFMSERITLKPVKLSQMASSLFVIDDSRDESILNQSQRFNESAIRLNDSVRLNESSSSIKDPNNRLNSSLRLTTSQRLYTTNQYSICTLERAEPVEGNEKAMSQFQKIQKQLAEIKEALMGKQLTSEKVREDPAISQELQLLRNNQVAQMISLLIKQNEAVKKCLNQMIQNEESLAKLNNEVYFEDRDQVESGNPVVQTNKPKPAGADVSKKDENCRLM